jgi:hypothetical protein
LNKSAQQAAAVVLSLPCLLFGGGALAQSAIDKTIGGTTSFQWQAFVDAYTDSPAASRRAVDARNPTGWSRFQVKHSRSLNSAWSMEGHLSLISTAPDILRHNAAGAGQDAPQSTRLDPTRLSLRYEGEKLSLLFGKSDLTMGVAELYSPVDRFEQFNNAVPMHRYRAGVWQVTAGWRFTEADELKLSVLPTNGRPPTLPEDSRWRTAVGSDPAFDVAAITRFEYENSAPSNWNTLLRYQATREGIDWFAGAYHGRAAYNNTRVTSRTVGVFPFVATVTDRTSLAPRGWSVFGGFTMTRGSVNYYGEAIYQRNTDGRDENYLRYVLGWSYRETRFANSLGWEEITPVVEYVGDRADGRPNATLFPASSDSIRPYKSAILTRLKIKFNNDWKVFAGVMRQFKSRDWVVNAGLEHRVNDNLSLLAQATFLGGPEATQFGRWNRNDNVYMGFDWRF